jgi:hypothetical protein
MMIELNLKEQIKIFNLNKAKKDQINITKEKYTHTTIQLHYLILNIYKYPSLHVYVQNQVIYNKSLEEIIEQLKKLLKKQPNTFI